MKTINQSQLQRQVEILVANGKADPAQAVLATIGYRPENLDAGQSLLQTWLAHKSRATALLAAQKEATEAEAAARWAAHTELTNLSQTVRVLFGANGAVLTSLGLQFRRSHTNGVEMMADGNGNGNGNSNHHQRTRLSTSIAAVIARWRLLLANIPALSAEQQSDLAGCGWDSERLAAAAALVEACAAAHTGQKQKTQAYRAESAAAYAAETALRQWYSQVTRLSRLAIKRADPDNHAQLRGLLGL